MASSCGLLQPVSMKKPHLSNGSLPLQFAAAYRRVVRHSKIGRSMSALGHQRPVDLTAAVAPCPLRPKSGQANVVSICPLCAISGRERMQRGTVQLGLLDHLIGGHKK